MNLIFHQYLQNYLNYEQNDYILRMELEEGIAVNLALKENIFAVIIKLHALTLGDLISSLLH